MIGLETSPALVQERFSAHGPLSPRPGQIRYKLVSSSSARASMEASRLEAQEVERGKKDRVAYTWKISTACRARQPLQSNDNVDSDYSHPQEGPDMNHLMPQYIFLKLSSGHIWEESHYIDETLAEYVSQSILLSSLCFGYRSMMPLHPSDDQRIVKCPPNKEGAMYAIFYQPRAQH